jgi:hypothetical protein
MANPFTRPVAYKYKPLGFEAFAAPLARKQAAYDTAIEAYDDMSFDLPELPGDEKQVKAIESKLTNNLTALRDELTNTKDFKTAVSKLKQLNKYYTNSDETQSYRSNYDAYQKWKEERRKLVEKGDLSEEDYKQEVGVTLGEFNNKGGTNYDPKTGEYNSINLVRSPHNMDEEIQKWAYKLGKANHKEREIRLKQLSDFGFDIDKEAILKLSEEGSSPEEIQEAVKQGLLSSTRFKEYLKTKADLEFRFNKLKDKDWNPDLKPVRVQEIEEEINELTPVLKEAQKLSWYERAITTGATDITQSDLDNMKKEFTETYGNHTEKELEDAITYRQKYIEELDENYKTNPDEIEKEFYKDYYYNTRLNQEAAAMGITFGGMKKDISSLIAESDSGSKGGKEPFKNKGVVGIDNIVYNKTNSPDLEEREEKINTEYSDLLDGVFSEEAIIEMKTNEGLNLLNPDGSFANIGNTMLYALNTAADIDGDGKIDPSSQFSNTKEDFEKNPEYYTTRMGQVLTAYSRATEGSTSLEESKEKFDNLLEEYNIGFSENDELTNQVFNNLYSRPDELSKLATSLTAAQKLNQDKEVINEFKNHVEEVYWEDPITKSMLSKIRNSNPNESMWQAANPYGAYNKHDPYKGTIYDKAFWKKGSENEELSVEEVVKLAGYEDLEDALKKGYDFKEPGALDKDISPSFFNSTKERMRKFTGDKNENYFSAKDILEEVKQYTISKDPGKYDKEQMIYKIFGNDALSDYLKDKIPNAEAVINYTPAFASDWDDANRKHRNNTPGFTTSGPDAGTKLTGKWQPSVIGQNLMLTIPYVYKDKNGDEISNNLYINFNNDKIDQNLKESIVTQIIFDSEKSNQANAGLIRDAAYRMRFNLRLPNNAINNIYAEALPVNPGESKLLDWMPVTGIQGESGISLKVMKNVNKEGTTYYTLMAEDKANPDNVETNSVIGHTVKGKEQPLKFKTANEVKTYLGQEYFKEDINIKAPEYDPGKLTSIPEGSYSLKDPADIMKEAYKIKIGGVDVPIQDVLNQNGEIYIKYDLKDGPKYIPIEANENITEAEQKRILEEYQEKTKVLGKTKNFFGS